MLLTVGGYGFRAGSIDRRAEAAIRAALPTPAARGPRPLWRTRRIEDALGWGEPVAGPATPAFEPLPFDHPLFRSIHLGTTGGPRRSSMATEGSC